MVVVPLRYLSKASERRIVYGGVSDLVQPRSETVAYTTRRTAAFDKYRKGAPTSTTYPESDKAKLSDTGK